MSSYSDEPEAARLVIQRFAEETFHRVDHRSRHDAERADVQWKNKTTTGVGQKEKAATPVVFSKKAGRGRSALEADPVCPCRKSKG
jgi:hypothetical protein